MKDISKQIILMLGMIVSFFVMLIPRNDLLLGVWLMVCLPVFLGIQLKKKIIKG